MLFAVSNMNVYNVIPNLRVSNGARRLRLARGGHFIVLCLVIKKFIRRCIVTIIKFQILFILAQHLVIVVI